MKTEKQQAEKSMIEKLREIRDKISAETQSMTFEQLKKYIADRQSAALHPTAHWS